MWESLLKQLATDQAEFAEQCAHRIETLRAQDTRIYCAAGCSHCCTLTVNGVFSEALQVAQTLTQEQFDAVAHHAALLQSHAQEAVDFKDFLRRNRSHAGSCPFLDAQGRCSVYAIRPFSCRALFATRNSDWCAVDFAALHPAEREAFMSSLDRSQVAFPTHYLAAPQQAGARWELQAMAAMENLWGFSVSGNLVFMVFLEQQMGLSRLIPQGLQITLAALDAAGFNRPYLISCDESMGLGSRQV